MDAGVFSADAVLHAALYGTFIVMIVAIAANDCAGAVALVCVDGTVDMRAAQVLIAVFLVVGAVFVAPPVLDRLILPLIALEDFRAAPFAGPTVLFSAVVPLALATVFGVPVSASALVVLAVLGVIVERGGGVDAAAAGRLAFALLLLPAIACGVGRGLAWAFRDRAVSGSRPRDALTWALPGLAALLAAATVVVVALLTDLHGPVAQVSAIVAGIAVIAAFAVGGVYLLRIRRSPFWVSNDRQGFEAAHGSLSLACGALGGLLLSGVNVGMAIALLSVLLNGGGAGVSFASPPLWLGLGLAFLTVLLAGHHLAGRLERAGLTPEPSQAAIGTIGAFVGAALAAVVHAPLPPSLTLASGQCGAAGDLRTTARWLGIGLLVGLLSFALSFAVDLALRLLAE